MFCLRCGRETENEQAFCLDCQKVMAAYPVDPNAVVQLPVRKQNALKKTASLKIDYICPTPQSNAGGTNQGVKKTTSCLCRIAPCGSDSHCLPFCSYHPRFWQTEISDWTELFNSETCC